MDEETYVYIPNFEGTPTRVPLRNAKAFQEAQKELKRKAEAGEPLLTPEEKAETDAGMRELFKELGLE